MGGILDAIEKGSLSLRRAWIEIWVNDFGSPPSPRSLTLRRAWIEITVGASEVASGEGSLSLRSAWIEINREVPRKTIKSGRSPYGERGLK